MAILFNESVYSNNSLLHKFIKIDSLFSVSTAFSYCFKTNFINYCLQISNFFRILSIAFISINSIPGLFPIFTKIIISRRHLIVVYDFENSSPFFVIDSSNWSCMKNQHNLTMCTTLKAEKRL